MYSFSAVSSLAKIEHHFSSVLHSDLRVTLRDTVLSAIRGEEGTPDLISNTSCLY